MSESLRERFPGLEAAGVGTGPLWAVPAVMWRLLGALAAYRWLALPLGIALGSRVAVLSVGFVGVHLVPDNSAPWIQVVTSGKAFLDRWYQWDGAWYATIALGGYQPVGHNARTLAFWPLLPSLEWLFSRPLMVLFPLMRMTEAVFWAGVVVTTVSFLVGAVMFFRLIEKEHGPDVARRAVALLAFAPGALFYSAGYPEGLLLVGVVGCLWALRRERWALAGFAGGLAAVSHVPGSLLVLPFAWDYLRRRGRPGRAGLWVLLIPLGPVLWLAYLWTLTGHYLAPVSAAYAYWPHRSAWPWETFVGGIDTLFRDTETYALSLVDLGATLAALGASVWALRAGYASWGIWGFAVLALYLAVPAAKPFEGMLRYVLPVLPIWLLVARLTRHPLLESAAVAILAVFLGLLTALYVNTFWVA